MQHTTFSSCASSLFLSPSVLLPPRLPIRFAQPPSRAELTRRRSVSVGYVVVPRYPLSVPWTSSTSPSTRRCPTRSAQPPSRAELTRRLPVLVGSVVVPRYPLSTPVAVKYFLVVAPPVPHNLQPDTLARPGLAKTRDQLGVHSYY